jgi:hypothetical protein
VKELEKFEKQIRRNEKNKKKRNKNEEAKLIEKEVSPLSIISYAIDSVKFFFGKMTKQSKVIFIL